MQPIKNISIPTPCHEDWQQMTPVDRGRHCQSCCKTVVDFTEMSNAEVIRYLSTHTNACGRINDDKLVAINNHLVSQHRKRFSWKGLVTAITLSMLFIATKTEAQGRKERVKNISRVNSKDLLINRKQKEILTARTLKKVEIIKAPIDIAVVKKNITDQLSVINTTIGGITVTEVEIRPDPVYDYWWYEFFGRFY